MYINIEKEIQTTDDSENNTLNPIVEHKVFQEMVNTEKSYNKSLTLLDLILQNVNVSHSLILSQFKSLIPVLRKISDALLENISTAVKTETANGAVLREQRRQLITAFFIAYKDCAQYYEQFAYAYKDNKNPFKEVEEYVTGKKPLEVQGKPALKEEILALINIKMPLALQAHLIQPIQRGPRYLLLLGETEKHTNNVDSTNLRELIKIKQIVATFLFSVNSAMSKPSNTEEKPYEFGDYTRALIAWLNSGQENTVVANVKTQEEEKPRKGYQFGDISRGIYRTFFGSSQTQTVTQPQPQVSNSLVSQVNTSKTNDNIDDDVFTII